MASVVFGSEFPLLAVGRRTGDELARAEGYKKALKRHIPELTAVLDAVSLCDFLRGEKMIRVDTEQYKELEMTFRDKSCEKNAGSFVLKMATKELLSDENLLKLFDTAIVREENPPRIIRRFSRGNRELHYLVCQLLHTCTGEDCNDDHDLIYQEDPDHL